MSHGYNRAGNLISMTYPSGRVLNTEYDPAGRMAGVRDQSSGTYYAGAAATDATNRIQYSAHGAVSVMKLGNGLWEHTNFNTRLQPSEIGLGTSSTSSGTLGLTYDYGTTTNNGNVLSVSYVGGGLSYTQIFGYDTLNRLTTSQEGSAWSQTNSYDRYGNRSIVGGSLSFNTANNRITNAGYVYDSAGNLTNDGLHSYGFDGDNKIKSVDGVSDVYRYDGDGNRVRKNLASGEKVRMVYSGDKLIAEYDLSSGGLLKEYVYDVNDLLAIIEPGAGAKYATTDHLGTPRVITNSAGIVSRHDYKPFGEEIGANIGYRTTGMGFSMIDSVRQQFTSYERDKEMGLDYAKARYYGNSQGRFTSPDPMSSSGRQAEPQSWNRYAYVGNNPLMFTDPSGLIWGYRDYQQDGKKMREFQWFDGDQAGEGFTNYNHSYFVSQNEVIWLDSGSSAFLQVSKERFSDAEFASLASTDPANLSQEQRKTLNRAVADTIWAIEGPRIKAVASLVGGLFGSLGSSLNLTFGAASRQASRLPPVLFHYTDEAGAAAIQSSQLGRADRFLYLTNQGGLSPLQAQLELSLPAQNSARALFAIDSQALNTSNLLRSGRVTGNVFSRPGGGTEFMFNKGTTVPPNAFTRFRF